VLAVKDLVALLAARRFVLLAEEGDVPPEALVAATAIDGRLVVAVCLAAEEEMRVSRRHCVAFRNTEYLIVTPINFTAKNCCLLFWFVCLVFLSE